MNNLFEILGKSGKFNVEINKHGTIPATLSLKQGTAITEVTKILFENLPNANRTVFTDDGKLDITPALLQDAEVKKALPKGAKTVLLFLGPEFLIVVSRDENGKWIDADKAIPWDKIQGPAQKKEGKGKVEVQVKKIEPKSVKQKI